MSIPPAAADRTCLVTGASSGIGADIARELARRGYGVTLVARRAERLRDLASALASGHGVRTEVIACDLADAAARVELTDKVSALGLTIEALVNNAGSSTVGPIHKSDRAREVAMIRTNVEAVADLCSAVVPGMVERCRGAILNVASTAAFQPLPGQAGYAAGKSFVLSFTQALRGELRGTGVTATALCPGPVETEFADTAGIEDPEASLPKFMWVPSPVVAREAVDGMIKGRAVVIPGIVNRVGSIGAQVMPRSLLVPILAKGHPGLK